ncbi:TlpA disulfide reductase family protein [uncultured Akkermansia sp.]|uniref:TlpA disulfide reductase family protein n=1 Tax=uncultured Akkermansia sp. TaxID=512294 RepID=UPI0031F2FAD3
MLSAHGHAGTGTRGFPHRTRVLYDRLHYGTGYCLKRLSLRKNCQVFPSRARPRSPPCIASMPHLQELQEKFQSKGFTVIGSHCQIPSPRVKQFLEEKKITFPIYQSLSIPEAPCPGGLPPPA